MIDYVLCAAPQQAQQQRMRGRRRSKEVQKGTVRHVPNSWRDGWTVRGEQGQASSESSWLREPGAARRAWPAWLARGRKVSQHGRRDLRVASRDLSHSPKLLLAWQPLQPRREKCEKCFHGASPGLGGVPLASPPSPMVAQMVPLSNAAVFLTLTDGLPDWVRRLA